jgi:TonB-linked SusC/RagA family outer membrane protein
MLWPLVSAPNSAFGQYYTTASTGQLDASAYSVERYANSVPELQKKITLKREKVARKNVLDEIALKAGLGIAYNPNLVSLRTRITINFEKISVAKALQKVLEGTEFQAVLSRTRKIVLKKRPTPKRIPIEIKPIDQEINGTVTDAETGNPLPAVNVFVMGTNIGTSTDRDGNYNLSVPDDVDSLRFSYIGYRTTTVAIDNRNIINVPMAQQIQAIGEMVVTALGISRSERSIGYSTQKVQGEDLTYTNENNVIGSLAGKVAGVQISGSSGASLGGTSSIKIRGVNSLQGEGQPLIVVDGTPISNANFSGYSGQDFGNLGQDVNPNDVESVNILKGPSASALYGIRGQNGVVMITTKDGRGANDFRVEINSGFSAQRATNFMEYQNLYGGGYTQEWQTLPNGQKYVQAHADESWGPKLDGTMVREFSSFYPQDPMFGQLTPFDAQPDNVKNFYDTGFKSNQGITISGGGENSNYRLSFNDTRVTGVVPNTELRRNNLGVAAGIDVSDEWRFSTNLTYASNDAQRPPQGYGYGATYFRQWFQRNVEMENLKNYQYSDGTIKHWNIDDDEYLSGEVPVANYWSNPYFLTYESPTLDGRNRFFGDVGVEFNPMQGLSFSGFIRGDVYVQNIQNRTSDGGAETPGYTVGKYENREMNYELKAQYTQSWDDFSLDATLGTNMFDEDYSYLSQATVGGLTSPGYFNIDASVDRPENNSYIQEKRILSAYGLASLGFKETYFVDVSLRNDKSSTLPDDNNSYWYPSVSGSFVSVKL